MTWHTLGPHVMLMSPVLRNMTAPAVCKTITYRELQPCTEALSKTAKAEQSVVILVCTGNLQEQVGTSQTSAWNPTDIARIGWSWKDLAADMFEPLTGPKDHTRKLFAGFLGHL